MMLYIYASLDSIVGVAYNQHSGLTRYHFAKRSIIVLQFFFFPSVDEVEFCLLDK